MISSDTIVLICLIVAFLLIILLCCSKCRRYLRRTARFVLYDNLIVGSLRNRFLQIVLPGFVGMYFLTLDVWGDKWSILKNHQETHEVVFAWLVVLSLCMLVCRGIADLYESRSDRAYIAFLESFSVMTSKIVNTKLRRFKDESRKLKPGSNVFKQITQPKDQINLILSEIESLLLSNFGIKQNDSSITIMHNNPGGGAWFYKYKTKDWNHTKAQSLIDGASTAAECLRTGEAIFHPCKKTAKENGNFHFSDRDVRYGNGSVFCYPIVTNTPNYDDRYVISIVTYGKPICDPLDRDHAKAISGILSDICRRIELELTLESIKEWLTSHHGKRQEVSK